MEESLGGCVGADNHCGVWLCGAAGTRKVEVGDFFFLTLPCLPWE